MMVTTMTLMYMMTKRRGEKGGVRDEEKKIESDENEWDADIYRIRSTSLAVQCHITLSRSDTWA